MYAIFIAIQSTHDIDITEEILEKIPHNRFDFVLFNLVLTLFSVLTIFALFRCLIDMFNFT